MYLSFGDRPVYLPVSTTKVPLAVNLLSGSSSSNCRQPAAPKLRWQRLAVIPGISSDMVSSNFMTPQYTTHGRGNLDDE
jgi:hypothetical protein